MRPAGMPFVGKLPDFGERVAVRTAEGVVTYARLAELVAERADMLGATRRLVLVAGANRLEPLITYLAALWARHPVVLVAGDDPAAFAMADTTYDPDVVAGPEGQVIERRPGTAHDLHPELALLLSTSGSTGSPKLVRLSLRNIQANAESIAQYLDIRPGDVAAMTLPMHYCYGLSVINSHLLAGASLMLTSRSVVDDGFWEEFRAAGATTFAAVPYTFDLLDRVGFAEMELPSLRYLTQAGGRLGPDRVRRFAELGRRRGWDLFVMYGQTEATARMAYLPPELALSSPGSIGVPVPGGSFRLEPLPDAPPDRSTAVGRGGGLDVGELVYEGPNVMLGYAETPGDLALGRVTGALHTGDVARRNPDGLYEIVGRRSRFAKIFGLRINLDEVERLYADAGILAVCAATQTPTEERLVVAVSDDASPVDTVRIVDIAKQHLGLPPGAVAACPVRNVPRLPNGKPDYRAVADLAATAHQATADPGDGRDAGVTLARLRQVYAEVLHHEVIRDQDSFVSLEGDSLSYVELSIRVEEVLGQLPPNWHATPIGDLVPAGKPRRGRALEASVLLRALAIVGIVGSHANLFALLGGAHLLLAVAGFNFGRFHLTDASRNERLRRIGRSVARIAVPSVVWIGIAATFTAGLGWKNVLLLNGLLGPRSWVEPAWYYWFIEALVSTLLGLTLLMALPFVDKLERRWPFAFPMVLAGLGLLTRYQVVEFISGDVIHRASVVFWLFALGWATVKAKRPGQRVLVSAVVAATVPGFFGDVEREAVVAAGMLALVWVPWVRVPAWLSHGTGILASASLYIYLVHWQVYPHLEHPIPWLATLLSLLAGVLLWQFVETSSSCVARRRHATSNEQSGRRRPAFPAKMLHHPRVPGRRPQLLNTTTIKPKPR